jgi:hypothetical protein
MESKYEIYNAIPKQYQPATILIPATKTIIEIKTAMAQSQMQYPVYAKPDIGGRGIAVQKIENEEELINYLNRFNVKMLVQENIAYKKEAGIFYYRYPNEKNGHITGIVMKDYLKVTGDGKLNIYELLLKNERYILQIPALKQLLGPAILNVLPIGEEKILVPVGNHARGSKFIDASNLITKQLETQIDTIAKQIPGYFFGRMDVKFDSINELAAGKNFSIIELNGAGSEPTHMYDPKHSIFYAWKELIKHWKIMYRVSTINHKLGVPYISFKEGKNLFSSEKKYFDSIREILAKEPEKL